MLFTPDSCEEKLKIGYFDGLRYVENLRGSHYFVRDVDNDELSARLFSLSDEAVYNVGRLLGYANLAAKRMLFEKIIPHLSAYLKLEQSYNYADFVIALLEYVARHKKIDRFRIYSFEQLRALARKEPEPTSPKTQIRLPVSFLMANRREAVKLLNEYLLYGG